MYDEDGPDEIEIPFTFNEQDKVAKKKLFREPQPVNITQVIVEKLEGRSKERCSKCGSLKEKVSDRLNFDGAKWRMICLKCKNKKRRETAAANRAKK